MGQITREDRRASAVLYSAARYRGREGKGRKKKRRGGKRKTSRRQLRIDVYRLDVRYDCRVCRIRYGDRNEALHNHESNYHELLRV